MIMNPKLTIGMATYDDFHGVYFSIQSLRMHHPEIMDQVEFIVVDNNPESNHGQEVKKFVENQVQNGRYIPFTEWKSTGVRDKVFREARGEYVICMDCHVIFPLGSIKSLIDHYEKNPDTRDIIQGPLMYDDFNNFSTHFHPEWSHQMFGTWATNRGALEAGEPFDIPMCGLGVFSCKKEHWVGINENFRGFGGEEWYVHEKFRRAGGRAICLPSFKWMHRFGRPEGAPFPLTLDLKVRNYMIGWMEIYKDPNHKMVQSIIDHFSEWKPRQDLDDMFGKVLNELY